MLKKSIYVFSKTKSWAFNILKPNLRLFALQDNQVIVDDQQDQLEELTLNSSVTDQNVSMIPINNKSSFDYYKPINIGLVSNNKNDYFVRCFFFILGETFQIKLEAIHAKAMEWIFFEFVSKFPIFSETANYHPSFVSSFTRNFAKYKKDIRDDLKNNTKTVNYFGRDMLVKDFYHTLKKLFKHDSKSYYYIFTVATVQKTAKYFNSAYADVVWYFDSTEIAELGNGIDKNTGPALLVFLDCASRKVLYHKLFPSKKKNSSEPNFILSSETIINTLKDGIKKCGDQPYVLHGDSDQKNRTVWFFDELEKLGIVASLNKNIWGVKTEDHGNQVIESFNLHFKQKLAKVLKDQNYSLGSLLHASFKKKEAIIDEVIEFYNNKQHSRLGTKFTVPGRYKQGSWFSPNECYENHTFFMQSLFVFRQLENNSQANVPSNIYQINNLNFYKKDNQEKFTSYASYYFMYQVIHHNNISPLVSLIDLKNNRLNEEVHSDFYKEMLFLFSYALANGDNKNLVGFYRFKNTQFDIALTIRGPSDKKDYTTEWISLQFLKEDFATHFPIFFQLMINTVLKLRNLYVKTSEQTMYQIVQSVTNNQTMQLMQFSNVQTQKIINHSTNLANNLNTQITQLQSQVSVLRTQLEFFYKKEKHTELMRQKRKNRQKRPLTPAIQFSHFAAALKLTDSSQEPYCPPSKHFQNARNRIALFLLFFSGMRVSSLFRYSFQKLIDIFYHKETIAIPIDKKRDKKFEQIFIISGNIYKDFVFGSFNLINDLKLLLTNLDQWAVANNIDKETAYQSCFYTSYVTPNNPVSRVHLNNTMNRLIRAGVSTAEGTKKNMLLYSTQSIRVHFITEFIREFGIDRAKAFIGHEHPNTTNQYNRNVYDNKDYLSFSNLLTNDSSKKKIKSNKHKLSNFDLETLGSMLASLDTSSKSSAIDLVNNAKNGDFTFKLPKAEKTLIHDIPLIEAEESFRNTEQNRIIQSVDIKQDAVNKARKYLAHRVKASKRSKKKLAKKT